MKVILGGLINLLNQFIKKDKCKVVFSGKPDFDDMLRGILPELEKFDKVVILLDSKHSIVPKWFPRHLIVYYKWSFKGLYSLLTSSRIYYTHGLYDGFEILSKQKQVVINLWHGMPIKKIGNYIEKGEQAKFHYTLATSPFYQKVISNVFGVHKNKVILTGLPRNELILLGKKKDINDFNKTIIWLPTYQERVNNELFFGFGKLELQKINSILENNNTILILKPHPYEKINKNELLGLSNIKIIDDTFFSEREITLYEFLGTVDELWTDYSSVFIDFIVTGKPIVFLQPDSDHYINTRGLIPEVAELKLPGKVIKSQSELINYLLSDDVFQVSHNLYGNTFLSFKTYDSKLVEEHIKG